MENPYESIIQPEQGQTSDQPIDNSNPYAKIHQRQDDKFKLSVDDGLDRDPARVAKAQKIAKERNLPAFFVEENLDDFDKVEKKKPFDQKDIKENNPYLYTWLQKPENVALMKNDIEVAKEMEGLLRKYKVKQEPTSLIGDITNKALPKSAREFESGLYMLRLVHGVGDQEDLLDAFIENEKRIEEMNKSTPDYVTKFQEKIGPEMSEVSKSWKAFVKTFEEDKDRSITEALADIADSGGDVLSESFDIISQSFRNPKAVAYQGMESAIQSLGPTAIGIPGAMAGAYGGAKVGTLGGLPGVLAGATFGLAGGYFLTAGTAGVAVEYMSTLKSAMQEKKINLQDKEALRNILSDKAFLEDVKGQAIRKGLTVSAVERLTELMGAKFLSSAFKAKTVGSAVGKAAGGLATEVVGEAAGEAIGTAAQKKDIGELAIAEGIQEGISALALIGAGGAVSLTVGGSVAAVNKTQNLRNFFSEKASTAIQQVRETHQKSAEATLYNESLVQLQEKVNTMELPNNSPEALESYIEIVSEGESTYFQAEEFKNHWEKQGVSALDKADEIFPNGRKDLEEALESGNALSIPLSKFISTYYNEESFGDLAKIARQNPDSLNLNEAQSLSANLNEVAKQLAKEAKEDLRKMRETRDVEQEFKKRLVEMGRKAGRSKKQAEAEAELYLRGFRANAIASNVPFSEMLKRFDLQIEKFRSPEIARMEVEEMRKEAEGETRYQPKPIKQVTASDINFDALPFDVQSELEGRISEIQNPMDQRLSLLNDLKESAIAFQILPSNLTEEQIQQLDEAGMLYKEEDLPEIKRNDVTIRKQVRKYGKIKTDSVSKAERKRLRENGVSNIFSKNGKPIDDLVMEMSGNNVFFYDENTQNGPDALIEALINDEISERDTEADALEAERLQPNAYTLQELAQEAELSEEEMLEFLLSPAEEVDTRQEAINQLLQDDEDFRSKLGIDEDTEILFQRDLEKANRNPLGLYSFLEQEILNMNFKSMPGKDLLNRLKKTPGIKKEELEFTGIIEFLEGYEGKISKEEVMRFLQDGGVRLEEVVLGGRGQSTEVTSFVVFNKDGKRLGSYGKEEIALEVAEGVQGRVERVVQKFDEKIDETKYSEYTLEGGENYREVLLQFNPNRDQAEVDRRLEELREISNGDIEALTDEQYAEYLELMEFSGTKSAGYKSSHWDQKNVLAHFRISERKDKSGRKVMLVDEIQSDWHQEGRKKGYRADNKPLTELPSQYKVEKYFDTTTKEDRYRVMDSEGRAISNNRKTSEEATNQALLRINKLQEKYNTMGVPDAPFKNTEAWAMLAFKRILRLAAEQGYDAVSWTPGQIQADRYSLSSEIKNLSWRKTKDRSDLILLKADNKMELLVNSDTGVVESSDLEAAEGATLDAVIGKELADKVLAEESGSLSGDGLKVGGEGMIGFYDKILPKAVGKYVSKLDKKAKVGINEINSGLSEGGAGIDVVNNKTDEVVKSFTSQEAANSYLKLLNKKEGEGKYRIDGTQETIKVWNLELTDKMKEKILDGQTLFQDEGKPRGFSTFDIPNKILVGYFEDQNASTGIHEMGHVFLELMRETAANIEQIPEIARSSEQSKFLNDIATTLRNLEVTSFDEIQRDQHEKFARLFEAYMLEGKAPSQSLETIFGRFRTWLVNIYKSIRGIEDAAGQKLNLTDEMREVFDRLLVTEDEIRQAEEQTGYSEQEVASFINLMASGDTLPKELQDLKVLYEEVHEEAIKKLGKKHFQDLKRKATEEYRNRKKQLKFEFESRANTDPFYTAIDAIKTGEFEGEKLTTLPTYKIDPKSLEGILDAKEIQKIPKSMLSNEGLPLETVANAVGQVDPVAFIKDVVSKPSKKQFVDTQTELALGLEFEDVMTPGLEEELRVAALDALNNEKKAQVQALEMKLLFEKSPSTIKKLIRRSSKKLPTTAEIKRQAKLTVSNTAIKEAKSSIYHRLENKFRREAGILLSQGKIEESVKAKVKESLNYQMGREAREIEKKIEKTLAKNKKRFGKSDKQLAKQGDVDMFRAAEAILNRFKLVSEPQADKLSIHMDNLKKYNPEGYEKVSVFVDELVRMDDKPYQELTVQEFNNVMEVVDTIYSIAEQENVVEDSEGNEFKIDKVLNDMGEDLKKSSYKAIQTERESLQGIIDNLNSYLGQTIRVEGLMRKLGPAFREFIWERANNATTQYEKLYTEKLEKLQGILEGKLDKYFRDTDTKIDITKYFAEAKGKVKTLSRSEIMMALIHSGNDSNMRKLLLGRGWGKIDLQFEGDKVGVLNTTEYQRFLDDMVEKGVITKEMMDGVQEIWDLFEEIKPEVQKTHKKVYGYYFKEIEAKPIKFAFGTYRGGYAPAITDPREVPAQSVREAKASTAESSMAFDYAQTNKGFTQERVTNYNEPLLLEFGYIKYHVEATTRFIAIQPAVSDINKLLNRRMQEGELKGKKAMSYMLQTVDDKLEAEVILPWTARLATQGTTPPAASLIGRTASYILGKGISNANQQFMMGNLVNTIENLTDFTALFIEVKPRYVWEAFKNYSKSRNEFAKNVSDKSEYMNQRLYNQIFEISDRYNEIVDNTTGVRKGIKTLQDLSKKHTYIFQRMLQNQMDVAAWSAAYNQAIENGMTDKQAIKEADSVIRRMFSDGRAIDVSNVEAGSKLQKLFLTFYSYFNTRLNLLRFLESDQKKRGVMLGVLAPAILGTIIRKAMRKGVDDEDDGYSDDIAEILLYSPIQYTAALFPLGGTALSAVESALNSRPYGSKLRLSPLISTMENAQAVYKVLTKDNPSSYEVRNAMAFLGTLSGLPLAPVYKPIGYIIED